MPDEPTPADDWEPNPILDKTFNELLAFLLRDFPPKTEEPPHA